MSPRFPELFADAPLDRIVLELTEHAGVESYDRLRQALAPLRAQGLRLAIDDVGAGHSTFRHVLELSPEYIKLDMSLIRAIDRDTARRALAESITAYGRRTGCEVVAEGIETPAEFAALRDIGCDLCPGLPARPPRLDRGGGARAGNRALPGRGGLSGPTPEGRRRCAPPPFQTRAGLLLKGSSCRIVPACPSPSPATRRGRFQAGPATVRHVSP